MTREKQQAEAIRKDARAQSESRHAGGDNDGRSTAVPHVVKPSGEARVVDSTDTRKRDPDRSRPGR